MTKKIRVAGLIPDSITDGPGFRFTIFTQGCPHACEGCHNPETWSFEGGKWYTVDELIKWYETSPLHQGVTFSGGEPFAQAGALIPVAKKIHALGGDTLAFTGYTLDELEASSNPEVHEFLKQLDYLIDGPFELATKDIGLLYRGSHNQRLLKQVNGSWEPWDGHLYPSSSTS